jgi:hypothetical protein
MVIPIVTLGNTRNMRPDRTTGSARGFPTYRRKADQREKRGHHSSFLLPDEHGPG